MDQATIQSLSYRKLVDGRTKGDPWHRLRYLESASNVASFLGWPKNNSHAAKLISAYVIQSNQLFSIARVSPIETQPLVLYYGVLALSRATILAANNREMSFRLEKSHGLSPIFPELKLPLRKTALAKLVVKCSRGTFTQLLHATQNLEFCTIFDPHFLPVDTAWRFSGSVGNISQFQPSLLNAVARIPDLLEVFELSIGGKAACFPTVVREHPMTQTDYTVLPTKMGLPDPKSLRAALRLSRELEISKRDDHWWLGDGEVLEFRVNVNVSPESARSWRGQVSTDSRGFPYIIAPYPDGTALSTMASLFLAAFCLGSLSRYFPVVWQTMASTSSGSRFAPLIVRTIEVIQEVFPSLALSYLEHAATKGVDKS